MSSTFGKNFSVTTFGESHGGGVGVVIDGCPPNRAIDLKLVQKNLARRKPGQSHLSTPRAEDDLVSCYSGLSDDRTLGSPIMLMVNNKDARPNDYKDMKSVYRPSHADYTTEAKYGIRAQSGGGRASARETIGRVAAAAVAEQILVQDLPDLKVVAWVERVKDVSATISSPEKITRDIVDQTPLRCPDPKAVDAMEKLIINAKKKGDSVGGAIYCCVTGCPVGLGEPIFDKLEADLAKAVMSLPASKGFEIGSGFAGTYMSGSEHNDAFENRDGEVRTKTNRSGGIQGGISNGELIYLRVGFKPVATIFKPQDSVDSDGKPQTFQPKAGRHDPCVLPRAVPMVEAMVTLVIMDHYLRQKTLAV